MEKIELPARVAVVLAVIPWRGLGLVREPCR